MGSRLFPDDIQPGMHVTIHSRIMPRCRESEDGVFGKISRRLTEEELPVPPGYPMQVQGVSFPFVFCGVLKPGGGFVAPAVVDVRTTQVCRLDASYIEAIAAFSTELPDEASAGLDPNG